MLITQGQTQNLFGKIAHPATQLNDQPLNTIQISDLD